MTAPVVNRKKTFVAILATLLAAGFLATTLISYQVAKNSLDHQVADEMLPLTSDNIYSEIQRDLLRPILISSLMANDTFVRDWALDGEKNPDQISSYLGEIQKKYGTITAFFVADQSLNYYHPTGVIKVMDRENPLDQWYFSLRNSTSEYDINVDNDTADRSRLNIFINYRVFDYQGRFIGVTGVGLSVKSVITLINNYQRRYNRQIYFVNRQGDVSLHGDDFNLQTNLHQRPGLDALSTQILTTLSLSTTYTRGDQEEFYLNSRLVPEFDWYLIVEQRRHSGREQIDKSLIINILVSLAITVVVLLIAHFTLRGYQRQLIEMATIDKLTGALNRQAFEDLFDHLAKMAKRHKQSLALLAIDLDHFKEVNDNFGHQAGDNVLQNLSAAIREITRECDTLCRWGGEEFMLLLEHCDLDEAQQRAEDIRQFIQQRTTTFGREEIAVTVSIGVSEYRPGETLDAFVNRADGALYKAKREGRNRVITEG
ncbi:MAG: diguanylate cyclase [Porticoccaceae bacterium]|nr:diguanylate cyclase [Porticoccaceae bacterium]